MISDVNPFQILYVTDSPDPKVFVALFSASPVPFSLPIFQPGNVILKGTQGSGKSMLLNLLRPQIRLAYAKADASFPVPHPHHRFISAGINLTLSGALDIGQRPLSRNKDNDEEIFPLLFADFVNYYVMRDLVRSLDLISKNEQEFVKLVNIDKLDEFAAELSSDGCWFGYFEGVKTLDQLRSRLDGRLAAYRSFHQFNSDLPEEVKSTKTNIGDPIARAADVLKSTGATLPSTPLFIRIDQLERLYRSDVLRPRLGEQYRRIINKALGKRDSKVSYRIGTRRYAWEDDLTIFGTQDKLEHRRDFLVVDLDDKMRRKEDSKTWIFPQFAEDAFSRRLKLAGFEIDNRKDPLASVFGQSPPPDDVAGQYAKNADWKAILRVDDTWPDDWRKFLENAFKSDPFTALLAAAWARQKGGSTKGSDRRLSPPPEETAPWKKPYWKKERVRQCLMQIAARNKQRLRWSGKDTLLSLSVPNISVFLSVCHEIWDAFLRSEQRKAKAKRIDPLSEGIHPDIQTVGIQTASQEWYDKVSEQAHGHDRQRFVEVLGRLFRKWLLDDEAMSSPGHVGFSLEINELSKHQEAQKFLEDATDYGDLYDADHTTKNKDRRLRKKWYLNPILSAFFQIPETHPKEPRYVSMPELAGWFIEARIPLSDPQFETVAIRPFSGSSGSSPPKIDPKQGTFRFADQAEDDNS